MVERSIETKGSTPFSFRIFPKDTTGKGDFSAFTSSWLCGRIHAILPLKADVHGSIVQLVRMLACHARGHGFKSHWSRHSFRTYRITGQYIALRMQKLGFKSL